MKINVEERVEHARELFRQGYNCAQAVFVTYSDVVSLDPQMAATITGPLGAGMGRLREVCGTVSGMSLIAGFLSPCADPSDRKAKGETYALVQRFAEAFRTENGSIVCRELLGLACRKEDPMPAERTAEYYRKRPCVELVACAARIVGEYLQQRDETPESAPVAQ